MIRIVSLLQKGRNCVREHVVKYPWFWNQFAKLNCFATNGGDELSGGMTTPCRTQGLIFQIISSPAVKAKASAHLNLSNVQSNVRK